MMTIRGHWLLSEEMGRPSHHLNSICVLFGLKSILKTLVMHGPEELDTAYGAWLL